VGNGEHSRLLGRTVKAHTCGLVALGLSGEAVEGQAMRERHVLSPFQAQHTYCPYISQGVKILTIPGQAYFKPFLRLLQW